MACAKDTGLDRLQGISTLNINQKNTRFSGNEYVVTTADGDVLFNMKEEGSAMSVFLKGSNRALHIDAVDCQERKVFTLHRPCEFMSNKIEVFISGQLISVVRKEQTFLKPVFSINDACDRPVLRIKGEYSNYEFSLQTADKKNIGSISKQFRGVMKEMFSYADNYIISFPVDLDVRYKVAVLGACIFIDYRFHEK